MLLVANLQRRSTGCKAFSSRVCPLAGCGHFVTGSVTLHGVTGPVAISFVSLELLSFRNAQWPGSLSFGHSEADLVSLEEAPDSMGTCGEAATGYAASAVCAGHGTARHGTARHGRAGQGGGGEACQAQPQGMHDSQTGCLRGCYLSK